MGNTYSPKLMFCRSLKISSLLKPIKLLHYYQIGLGTYENSSIKRENNMRKIQKRLSVLLTVLYLQGCRYPAPEKPYAKYGNYGQIVLELITIGIVQQKEYVDEGRIDSRFEWNLECYKSYSVLSETQPNVAINIASQRGCSDITAPQYIHAVFMPKDLDLERLEEQQVIELLCQSTDYKISRSNSVTLQFKWVEEKPVCPPDRNGNTVVPEYRTYPVRNNKRFSSRFE